MKITRYALFLDQFELTARIGIHAFERAEAQRVAISIEIDIDPALLPARDEISAAPDYDWIRSEIRALVESRHFDLQETLASAIIGIVSARPEIRRARVRTAKLDVYADAKAVGCELEASRT